MKKQKPAAPATVTFDTTLPPLVPAPPAKTAPPPPRERTITQWNIVELRDYPGPVIVASASDGTFWLLRTYHVRTEWEPVVVPPLPQPEATQ